MALAHSYSSVKDFEGCPRRYHEVRILKKFKSQDTEATLYGTAVHKAFEDYIRDDTPLPAQFKMFELFVAPLKKVKGDVLCEQKMAIRADFTPCDFFDKAVWFRGVPDFLAINKTKARVADYKTGKSARFADPDQLELMAAMVMAHYPEVQTVSGILLFVVAAKVVKSEYTRADLPNIWSKWAGRASMIESAVEHGAWGAKPSPLCRFCPVSNEACEHR
ncbi:MAG: PD-(D/E)XK nuclease family protein [Verrucomicrobiaceae bacterium]|nr:MAG: PD-(D/E)XK nuclease family protein [Verrucomicrobiaceae bacterium]RPJ30553.1 MAG: PD-(D/E)XK nuclease family protein [Verrucomicrobiaceae bacterium]RPJ33432.1 MAG: PD-(D/E)XK nuclease family protein [Verrucomicrobiaceae bacterium]RPJ36103.1 MAG: PD-(D/E)XK nuclease family protein [Verrucomicrobiaceae bacterium]